MTDEPQREFSAVILAGGEGSRMGCDKALLTFRGKPLLERTVETLRALFDETLVVGRDPKDFGVFGANAVFSDDIPGQGPLGGIATGLAHMKYDRGFFVACDMPLLDAQLVAALLEEARAVDVDIVVPVHDGRPEPLHAVYAKTCLPAAERQIASGDLRVRALFETIRTHYWDVAAAGRRLDCDVARSFTNVNTKADLEALLPLDEQS